MRTSRVRFTVLGLILVAVIGYLATSAIPYSRDVPDAGVERRTSIPVPVAPVEGITLLRFPGLSYGGLLQEIHIGKDGTITRAEIGKKDGLQVDETSRGTVGKEGLLRLEGLLDRKGFYDGEIFQEEVGMDTPYVELTATKGGKTHTCCFIDKPVPGLSEIILEIESLVSQVNDWKRIGDNLGRADR